MILCINAECKNQIFDDWNVFFNMILFLAFIGESKNSSRNYKMCTDYFVRKSPKSGSKNSNKYENVANKLSHFLIVYFSNNK